MSCLTKHQNLVRFGQLECSSCPASPVSVGGSSENGFDIDGPGPCFRFLFVGKLFEGRAYPRTKSFPARPHSLIPDFSLLRRHRASNSQLFAPFRSARTSSSLATRAVPPRRRPRPSRSRQIISNNPKKKITLNQEKQFVCREGDENAEHARPAFLAVITVIATYYAQPLGM